MNMMRAMSARERRLLVALEEVNSESGTHSPSRFTLGDRIPELEIHVDACFLSNPYATDLFIERLQSDLLATGDLRKVLEFYPSQNHHIASLLAPTLNVDKDQVFITNGAVEAIQAALHRFAGTKIAVILPTFSPYYEYLRPEQECYFYKLSPDEDFGLDIQDFIHFVERNKVDTVCLINPNNPNGSYIPTDDMRVLLEAFSDLTLVILDESFVDFAYEDEAFNRKSFAEEAAERRNVIVLKSMSKDFGIAGVRAGYAIMPPEWVRSLLDNGYLWNISGLGEFFFRLFTESEFQDRYAAARLRYLGEAITFFEALRGLEGLRTYSTKANFCLVQLDDEIPIETACALLLIRHGVYVRDCRDKAGLEDGQYMRIAGRKGFENEVIVGALQDVIEWCHQTAQE